MALQAQGKPFVYSTGVPNVGVNENGDFTANSIMYRGLPYSAANALDRKMIDIANELVKPSLQAGQRVIAAYMRTGQTLPSG